VFLIQELSNYSILWPSLFKRTLHGGGCQNRDKVHRHQGSHVLQRGEREREVLLREDPTKTPTHPPTHPPTHHPQPHPPTHTHTHTPWETSRDGEEAREREGVKEREQGKEGREGGVCVGGGEGEREKFIEIKK